MENEDNKTFYGCTDQDCLSFLEFGEIDLRNQKGREYHQTL
jgi:hypothetical protein